MRYTSIIFLSLAVSFAACTASAAEPSFQQLLNECLPGMSAESIPDRQQAQQRFQDACFALGIPGREAEREAACRLMAGKLGPETVRPARLWLLKQLEFVGRGECVDGVAAVLNDKEDDVRDWARRALENNPAASANVRLLEALKSAEEEGWTVALIHSLGNRAEAANAAPLAARLGDPRQTVATAAVIALGKIGTTEAMKALETARGQAKGTLQNCINDACLRCADRLMAEGKAAEAASVYETFCSTDVSRPIRLAALRGRVLSAGDANAPLILDMLAGADRDARTIAADAVAQISGKNAMKAFAEGFAKLPADGKVLLVAGLAARGDKAAGPVAVEAAKSNLPEVRLAGIKALAKLGDASAVSLLLAAMAAGGETAGPARETLQAIFGPGVDEAIAGALKDAGAELQVSLIEILESRRATSAVAILLQQASDPDAAVRGRVIHALGRIAQPESLPAMVNLLLKTSKGGERDDLEKAIMMVAARVGDLGQAAAPVLERLKGADDAQRSLLLPALGRIGGPKALAAVQQSLGSGNTDVRDAAIRALSNWPDASVAPQLMDLVDRPDSQQHRIQALRAYIRVISLPSERPATETLAMLKRAMEKAGRPEEKRLVLDRASSARCLETLRWVLPYVDDPELGSQASLTVVELAHHRDLMGPNHAEFSAALKKVTETCKDSGTVDRAKRYMQGL